MGATLAPKRFQGSKKCFGNAGNTVLSMYQGMDTEQGRRAAPVLLERLCLEDEQSERETRLLKGWI